MIKKQNIKEFSTVTIKKSWKYRRAEELKNHDSSLNDEEMERFTENILLPAFRRANFLYGESGGKVVDIEFVKEEPLRWRGILETIALGPKGAFSDYLELHPTRCE